MRTILLLAFIVIAQINSAAQKAEKIYVHTDKDLYLPGETIWFKAYLLENKSLSSKTNLFAGLYDENGKLLVQKTYPIFKGTAIGDFDLPDSTSFSNYQLRLYTRNKEVSGENDFIFPIRIFQKNNNSFPGALPAINATMQILPEGGKLVTDVNNHIIFKMDGALHAAIIDEAGKIIDSIYFDKFGNSRLQLTPLVNKTYFVSWRTGDGKETRKEFPVAYNNSVALHTEVVGNKLFYSINKNSNTDFLRQLTLTVKDIDEVVYTEKLQIGNKMQFVNSFTTDSLGTGLFTVFLSDANDVVQQRKNIYIPHNILKPNVQLRQITKEAKGKNLVEIHVNDTNVSSWSVAVLDENFVIPQLHTSIYDALITGRLTNEMHDAIADPKRTDVLLTGMSPQTSMLLGAADRYLTVSAKYNRSLHQGMALSAIINDKVTGKQFFNFNQSTPGNFLADGLIFYDSAKIYYQLTDKELTQNLTVNVPYLPPMPASIQELSNKNWWQGTTKIAHLQTSMIENFIQQKPTSFNEVQSIQTVTVRSKYVNPITKRLLELDDKYTSGMFKGLARGQQFNIIDDPSAQMLMDLFSYLPYRASGINVKRNPDGSRIFISSRSLDPYIVFVDEVETPAELIESMSMARVAYVKVITGIVAGSSFVTDAGAIYIYTRRGDEDKSSLTMKAVSAKGYSLPGEFINPDYSDLKNSKPADYRTTLYWNPYILTDKNNRSFTIEFYNNDITKGKILRLVGINNLGEPVEIEKRIE